MRLEEFQRWCEALHLPAETVDLIARSRFSPPARRTQARALNVSGLFPSRKMSVTIPFESQIELGAISLMEYDAGVVEFYDQPAPAFKLSYQTRSGGQAAPFHTPDFFVLRTDQAGWEEWKLCLRRSSPNHSTNRDGHSRKNTTATGFSRTRKARRSRCCRGITTIAPRLFSFFSRLWETSANS